MKIIISPAKKMALCQEDMPVEGMPIYLEEARILRGLLKQMKPEELQKLWQCNEKIAAQNIVRLKDFRLEENLSPALLAYEGIQYQYMAPQVFSDKQWKYVSENLRILSGFYGILKPLDGVIPYRLEMQARLKNTRGKDLYAFWGDRLYRELVREDKVVLNLASKEYSKAVEEYLEKEIEYYTCVFGELVQGKLKVKVTQAKMARGEMVRWLAQEQIDNPEKIKDFQGLDFHYQKDLSTPYKLVFLKEKKKEEAW